MRLLMTAIVALFPVSGAAQTLQAPTTGGLSATEVGAEPMMRMAPATYAALARQATAYALAADRLALRRATSPQVRALARAMAADHARILAELARPGTAASRLTAAQAHRLDALARADPRRFDALYLAAATAAHRHAWALHSGFAADGPDPRLRRLARGAVVREEAHLRRLPMRPMPY